jgi:nitrile hydratase
MNGVQDMGGIQNMGAIEMEENEPVFHEEWEKRVFAFNMATGPLRLWNLDMKRQTIEALTPPGWYLNAPYYERWLEAIISLLKQNDLVSEEELTRGKAVLELKDPPKAAPAEPIIAFMKKGNSARIDKEIPAKFSKGEIVRTRNINPLTHTRLPRYARDKTGVIDQDHGVFVFPDTHAQNWDQNPQHVYAVCFTAQELWGDEASPIDKVFIDLWDDYLIPAE